MAEKQATDLLDRIARYGAIGRQEKYIDDQDYERILDFVTEGKELNKKGRFGEGQKGLLLATPWKPNNFRYGIRSLKGFLAEVRYVICWNQYNKNNEVAVLAPDIEDTQKAGVDAYLSQATWERQYTVQIKSGHISQDSAIVIYRDWVAYDKAAVDRLVIVDLDEQVLVSVDYAAFQAYTAWNLFKYKKVCVCVDHMLNEKELKTKIEFM